MSFCIWYVSKYVALPGKGVGGRGFKLMSEFVKSGCKSLIITSDSNHLVQPPSLHQAYQAQEIDGVHVYWVRTVKYKLAKSFSRVLSWLHFEWQLFLLPKRAMPRPDAIIVSSLSLLTIINGLFLRRRYKCKLVFEIRDIWPLTLTAEGGFSDTNVFVRLLGLIEKLGYLKSDVIVGTMPNLSAHVENVVGSPLPVFCIPMGFDPLDLNNLDILPRAYQRDYFPSTKFIVAHVGSIGISNSLDTLFLCAESMQYDHNIQFLIVGDGDLKSFYIGKYGYLKNITFAPKIPKSMVQSLLARCDLLYFSTHVSEVWRYGQSLNKLMDYMLAGKPILASYSGFPSMINEAACGEFLPSGDVEALCSAIREYSCLDMETLREIGFRGKSWILCNRKYSELAKQYLNLIFVGDSRF